MARSGEPKTSPRILEAEEKALKVLELRKLGWGFDTIAQEVGYSSRSVAYNAMMGYLAKRAAEPVAAVRALEVERLETALEAIWPRVCQGDLSAIQTFIKLHESKVKLLGLAAPKRIDITAMLLAGAAAEGIDAHIAVQAAVQLLPAFNAIEGEFSEV